MRVVRALVVGLIAALVIDTAAAGAQRSSALSSQRAERIEGRVRTDTGVPVSLAEVIVTRGPDRAVQYDTTDSEGRFSIVWRDGTGDYLVYVRAPGRQPSRRRVQRTSETDSVFVVNVTLAPTVTQLATVSVVATRPKPTREVDPSNPPPGSSELTLDGRRGVVSPDLEGDVLAELSTLPGIHVTPAGPSVLGMAASLNQVMLDGMAVPGGQVPREARVTARVSSAPFDPTKGGIAGARVDLDFWGGGLFARRNGSVTLDAPPLQGVDAAGRALGHTYGAIRASGGADGSFGRSAANRYNLAAQLSRRTSDAVSLFSATPDALAVVGVSADSVEALRRVLEHMGVPVERAVGSMTSEAATVLARIDRTGFDWDAGKTRPRSGAMTVYAHAHRASPVGVTPSAAVTKARQVNGQAVALQGLYSVFFGAHQDRLTELRSSVSLQRDAGVPRSQLPAGVVLLGGTTDATSEEPGAGVLPVAFGGDGAGVSARQTLIWQLRSETQWYAAPTHRLKLAAETRFDGLRASEGTEPRDQYHYMSLDALAAGRPASATRILQRGSVDAGVWNGALALADFWKPRPAVDVVYGARIELNRFATRPAPNRLVAHLASGRTDAVPSRVHLSPRIGVTWRYGRPRAVAGSTPGSFSALGVTAASGQSQIRGGLGEFRSLLSPTLLRDPLMMTGATPNTVEARCVGEGIRSPDWRAPVSTASLRDFCADIGADIQRSESAPSAALLDEAFDAPRSWRSHLGWSTSVRGLHVSVDGWMAWNRNLPRSVDLNLRTMPTARLQGDGGRAVYVPPSAFIATTGAVAPRLARIDTTLSRVLLHHSDLASVSRQLTIQLAPALPGARALALSYTYGHTRAEYQPFDGAAFGNLWTTEWARGDWDVRHQIHLRLGSEARWLGGARLAVFGILRSGAPYTPRVASDVNGDGRVNDRAVVLSPAEAAARGDSAYARGMGALLASAPSHARWCITRHLGGVVPRNACEGPWSATMDARIELPWRFVRTGVGDARRVSVALHVSNPLGGLDRLLHGPHGTRGWGGPVFLEPTLLTVREFDASASRFHYDVNPRFGRSDPRHSVLRAPFRLTLDVSLELSRPFEEQQIERFLAVGRSRPGTRLDSTALRARYARSVPNVFRATLRIADSLFLEGSQLTALEAAERRYAARLDEVWGRMADEFARLPNDFDAAAVLRRQESYLDAAWALNREAALQIREILTPAQFRLAGGMLQYLVSERGQIRTRVFGPG